MSDGNKAALSYIPMVTVGMVVLNREWIIEKTLGSLLSQSYPHSRIFVVVADGGSKDGTVEKIKSILEKSDLKGYTVVSRECTIPEGRNICVENMQGDMLFFWDSDVVMRPNSMREMVELMRKENADVVLADCIPVFVDSVEEIDAKIAEAMSSQPPDSENSVVLIPSAGMGHTAIARNVFNSIRFDPEMTTCEDLDFSVRAREKGFKLVMASSVRVFDVNMWKKEYSDIHIDLPLKQSLRGLRKKARFSVQAHRFTLTRGDAIRFLLSNKRYLFYLGYIPAFILTIYGILAGNYLFLAFPVYLFLFAIRQIVRRGFKRGVQAVLRSIVVGLPFSLWLIYYLAKYAT